MKSQENEALTKAKKHPSSICIDCTRSSTNCSLRHKMVHTSKSKKDVSPIYIYTCNGYQSESELRPSGEFEKL